jgi:AcrR family transcriptional regulator
MEKSAPVGRPRKFDRNQAVHNAMLVFWSRGYENATLLDLQQAMGGITAPSFYHAFGSKENLFHEAVALYGEQEGSGIARELSAGNTARDAIEAMFEQVVLLVSGTETPKGCLVALGGINCSVGNSEVAGFIQELRNRRVELIRSRLERGVLDGDIPAQADVNGLANYLTTVVDGICLQAKDGVAQGSLRRTVSFAMTAFDANISSAATE